MRRQLNTLYVTTEGAWLKKDGANVVMEVAGEIRGRLPAHMLESLVCIGRVLVSPPLLGYCGAGHQRLLLIAQRQVPGSGGRARVRQCPAAPRTVPSKR